MGLDIFENQGTSEKGCVQIEDWGFSVHFGLGFKKIPFTLYTSVLVAKTLRNGAKFRYTKAGFKNYRNLNNFRQAVESPKRWNLTGSSRKNLRHFWNHKSFFTRQLLCLFLAQTWHTFYKSANFQTFHCSG